jgi:hypothetical protein
MTEWGYIIAGYVVTGATVATYAWSIRSRTRRVARAFGASAWTPPAAMAPAAGPDDEG